MKRIRLTEDAYSKLKGKMVNEVSYGLAKGAAEKSSKMFGELNSEFHKFYEELEFVAKELEDKYGSYFNNEENGTANPNKYINAIRSHADAIATILNKKVMQMNYFNDEVGNVSVSDYDDDVENNGGKDIYDEQMPYLRNMYNRK